MEELQDLLESTSFKDHLCIDVRYADDTTFIAAIFEKLQLSTNQLQQACMKYGMKINARKCKAITPSPNPISIDNNNVAEHLVDEMFLSL